MNWISRAVIVAGFLAIAAMCIYPPWFVRFSWKEKQYEEVHYAPIWFAPSDVYHEVASPVREQVWESDTSVWLIKWESIIGADVYQELKEIEKEWYSQRDRASFLWIKAIEKQRNGQPDRAVPPQPPEEPTWPGYQIAGVFTSRLVLQCCAVLAATASCFVLTARLQKSGLPVTLFESAP